MNKALYSSPAMDALEAHFQAQARRTVARETKLAARRYVNAAPHIIEIEAQYRWLGFGGEVPLLNVRGMKLRDRYCRFMSAGHSFKQKGEA